MAVSRSSQLSLSSSGRYSWRIIDFMLVCLLVALLGAIAAVGAAILPEITNF
jgi:hypothetical protein